MPESTVRERMERLLRDDPCVWHGYRSGCQRAPHEHHVSGRDIHIVCPRLLDALVACVEARRPNECSPESYAQLTETLMAGAQAGDDALSNISPSVGAVLGGGLGGAPGGATEEDRQARGATERTQCRQGMLTWLGAFLQGVFANHERRH